MQKKKDKLRTALDDFVRRGKELALVGVAACKGVTREGLVARVFRGHEGARVRRALRVVVIHGDVSQASAVETGACSLDVAGVC